MAFDSSTYKQAEIKTVIQPVVYIPSPKKILGLDEKLFFGILIGVILCLILIDIGKKW